MPTGVKSAFLSQKASELNALICEKHDLKGNYVSQNTSLITDLFFKKVKLTELKDEIKKIFDIDNEQARKLAADIAGIRLLIVDSWIDGDVKGFIKDMGADPSSYDSYVRDQKKAIKREKEELEAEMADSQILEEVEARIARSKKGKEGINEAKEKEDSVDLFREDVVKTINSDKEFIAPYNDILIMLLLDNGQSFKKQLENALLANEERIASKPLEFEDRMINPTIANWLKYFIKKKGANIFDNIVLSEFLAQDQNAKRLTREEKDLLGDILRLYRNLKFFPESMPNNTGESWEIIPLSSQEEMAKVRKKPLSPPTEKKPEVRGDEKKETRSEKVEEEVKSEKREGRSEKEEREGEKREGGSQKKIEVRSKKGEEVSKKEEEEKKEDEYAGMDEETKAKLMDLKKMLETYPKGSLERRVVEEEIKKLEIKR